MWSYITSLLPCTFLFRPVPTLSFTKQQPTDFHLSTFPLETVFNTESLITNLAAYAEQRLSEGCPILQQPEQQPSSDVKESILLLKIDAAADFFSSNNRLMKNPPPVLVDIILDPYILNILPQSLLPIGLYIVVLAACSYYLSGFIFSWMLRQRTMTKDKGA